MAQRRQRVLIIDDDDRLRDSLEDILEEAGFDVESVRSVAKGLSRHRIQPFDLMIVDYQLPEADGMMLAVHLSQGPNPVTIIMMSGYVSAEWIREQGAQNAVFKFLPKPVSLELLLETIDEALAA